MFVVRAQMTVNGPVNQSFKDKTLTTTGPNGDSIIKGNFNREVANREYKAAGAIVYA